MAPPRNCESSATRRDCLRLGLGALMGGGLVDVLRARAAASAATGARPTSCILVWMDGGPSHYETFDPKPVMALTSFMFLLSRPEVVTALKFRITEIDAKIASNGFDIADVARSTTTPAYVREIFELSSVRLRAEQEWARGLYDRILAGHYVFDGEAGAPGRPSNDAAPAPVT